MNRQILTKIATLGMFIAIMLLAVKFYGDFVEGKFQKERSVLVQTVEKKATEAEKARDLQKAAEIRTEIVREASADYEKKLKEHFDDSKKEMKSGFLDTERKMRENYENEMKKFKLSTTVSVGGDKKVTVVLQDTTTRPETRYARSEVARTFEWSDGFLAARVLVKGDSAAITEYSYVSDLTFKIRKVPGSLTRIPYQIIDLEPRNPKAILRPEDRQIIIEDSPNVLQKLFKAKRNTKALNK